MVKPSKSMQPEHVDLKQAAKRTGSGAAFGEDSFRNYMALKIATQRQQFGLVLPPPPKPDMASRMTAKRTSSPTKRQDLSDPLQSHRNRKRSLPNFGTPTNQHQLVNLGDTTLINQAKEPTSTSARVLLPSLDHAADPIKPAPKVYKRPTLLERPLSSQMTYTASPARSKSGPSDRSVRFADDATITDNNQQRSKKSKMESMISRLKKRHGRGNRRLKRKHAKRRKIENSRDNRKDIDQKDRIEIDASIGDIKQEDKEDVVVKMDSTTEISNHENGLEELEKLFAMADENDLELAHSADNDNLQSTSKTSPRDSITEREERSPNLTMEDGLAELDRMFESADATNDNSLGSSPHNSSLRNSEDEGCSTKIDKNSTASEVANDKSEHRSEEANEIFPKKDFDEADTCEFQNDSTKELEVIEKQQSPVDTIVFSASDDEDGADSSTPLTMAASGPPLSPKSIRRLRPDLFFYGVVVKVAGYTYPDNETIKRLLQKHGGDFETYETERVTHIIAQQLSTAKANVYKKARRPRPVCRPSWIVDSVKEGRLLPHGEYLLIEERDQQQMGIQKMFKKHAEGNKKETPDTSISPSSPQKSALIQKNPYAKKSNTMQSPEKPNGNLSALKETTQTSPSNTRHGSRQESPKKTDSRLINGKVRTVGTDPNFLDSYFASSRLSFIGSFKQREKSTHHYNGTGLPTLAPNSRKLIFHVDMDCFFASVVLRNYPQYQDKPVVISHHGNRSEQRRDAERGNNALHGHVPKNSSSECATCNYEARKYGIKKGMFLGRAKELCPELIILMYDFEGYEEVSQQVSEILDRFASSEDHPGIVESVSCDESYVELNFDRSKDPKTLYDHAFEVAESIRNTIFETTRCTASIGVGENKFLAKLGTDKAKPNKSYCVRDYRELLKDLSLRDVHGVGWRTEKKLTEEGLVSVQDVWDLGARGETELVRILGPGTGKKIFNFTQGKDDRAITPVERKTIGAECNYGVRFDGPYGIDHFMEGLAKEVEKRMEGISMKGKKLTLKIKQRKKGARNPPKFLGHGSCHNLSKSISIPGNVATRDAKIFKRIGLTLFNEFGIADINEIRGMGIVISSLEADNSTSKQTNASGMQRWLHMNNEQETNIDNEGTKQMAAPKDIFSGPNEVTNCVLPSTPHEYKHPESRIEVSEAENDVRNEESTPTIQLPPMSQIHMSQVKALPSELQKEIRSRLKSDILDQKRQGEFSPSTVDDASDRPKEPIWQEALNQNFNLLSTPEAIETIDEHAPKDSAREFFKSNESPLLIELPPMSQIQMSQVEALPDELKEQIYARMNRMAEPEIVDITEDEPAFRAIPRQMEQQQTSNRFRQTDLKRMMKLAAVQSGHERTNISLTQLDQLPLEIKLQVVNGDNQQIGVLSQHIPRRPGSIDDRLPKKSASNTANHSYDSSIPNLMRDEAKTHDKHDTIANSVARKTKKSPPEQELQSQQFRIIDKVDVWKEDLVPLREFLKDNCPVEYPKSVDMVIEFLSIVLKEGRLPSMVSMIRCIRNQTNNHWNRMEIFEPIVHRINELHQEQYGASLDVEWLLGMEE